MLLPDFINGAFESAGGFFIALSILKLHREKLVRGVSWKHVGFFSAWGLWNLYFYPHLGQWFSFAGGALLVATNIVWLGQIAYYVNLEGRREEIKRAFEDAVEERARIIYDEFEYPGPGQKPQWRREGNSLKQDEARRLARRALREQANDHARSEA